MSLQRSLGDANLFQAKEKQVFKLKEELHVERSRMILLADQQEKELKMLQQKGRAKSMLMTIILSTIIVVQ